MNNTAFLKRYLISITDRLTMLAGIISFAFWFFGIIWKIYTFSGTVFDIIFVSLGLGSTLFLILCPDEDSIKSILANGTIITKQYLAQVCSTLQVIAILWLWAGILTLIALFVSVHPVTDFVVVPGIFGILGVIVILFFPREDTFWED